MHGSLVFFVHFSQDMPKKRATYDTSAGRRSKEPAAQAHAIPWFNRSPKRDDRQIWDGMIWDDRVSGMSFDSFKASQNDPHSITKTLVSGGSKHDIWIQTGDTRCLTSFNFRQIALQIDPLDIITIVDELVCPWLSIRVQKMDQSCFSPSRSCPTVLICIYIYLS